MFASISTERLELEITELAARIAADSCRWLLLVAEFDRREAYADLGFHCCAAWLAWRCSVAPRAAREQVRVARRLGQLPLVSAAFARGELSYSKVRALTRVKEPGVEADLLELARCATAAQLERIVGSLRGVLDVEDARRAIERRHFSYAWEDDGSLSFRGRLAPEEGALLLRALEAGRAMTDGAPAPAEESGCPSADGPPRSGSAEPPRSGTAEPPAPPRPSNADALVTMAESLLCNGSGARGAGERYQVVVHVDASTLAGRPSPAPGATARDRCTAEPGATTCCELEHGPALSAETARRLACDGAVVAMLEGPEGTLHVGRRTRAIPPAIRRALRNRDRGCRFPGCPNHRWVDGHHIRHWAEGGETSLDNLVQLCHRHHTLVHEQGYTVVRERDGTLTFRTPAGARIPNAPPLRPGGRERPATSPRSRREGSVDCPDGRPTGPIPLPTDAGEPFDLHLTVSGLMEQIRPERPDGPLRPPDGRCRSPG